MIDLPFVFLSPYLPPLCGLRRLQSTERTRPSKTANNRIFIVADYSMFMLLRDVFV